MKVPEESRREGSSFQRINSSEFIFKPENIFFENCKRNVEIEIDQAFIFEQCQTLHELLECTFGLQENQLAYDLLNLFREKYSTTDRLGILDFYLDYQQTQSLPDYQKMLVNKFDDR